MSHNVIGKRFPRIDAALQVTGKSVYSCDLVSPGMLFAKALRSKHAHARILKVDTSKAEKLAGVKAVLTARDFAENRFGMFRDQPILADDKVRYLGDAVAVVAATSWDAAEEALGLIQVDYEPLPGIFDPVEAMRPESPKVHGESNIAAHIKVRFGDIDQGWKESDVIFEETITTPMVEHVSLEPHVAVAEVDDLGELLVMTSGQRPHNYAATLAEVMQMPMHKVRVATPAVGAGFGGKNDITIEPYIAMLAIKTGKPVKMTYSREDEFQVSTVRAVYILKYKSGLKKDGTLVARQLELIGDSGAYVSTGYGALDKACLQGAGPYRVPHVKIDGYLVYTNNPIGGSWRGLGANQTNFAYEIHMDTIAAEMGMDPVELRLKNLLVDNSMLPTGQVLRVVALTECMEKAVKLAGWKKKEVKIR